jgi:hypothetical protein
MIVFPKPEKDFFSHLRMKSLKVCDAENGTINGSQVNFCVDINIVTIPKSQGVSGPTIKLTDVNTSG